MFLVGMDGEHLFLFNFDASPLQLHLFMTVMTSIV